MVLGQDTPVAHLRFLKRTVLPYATAPLGGQRAHLDDAALHEAAAQVANVMARAMDFREAALRLPRLAARVGWRGICNDRSALGPHQDADTRTAYRLRKRVSALAKQNNAGTTLGFEAQLWAAAEKLRGNMEPFDYKHVALGLIFLKYISDAFEAKRAALLTEELAAPEDPEECLAENVFWVPKAARWSHLQARAKQTTIGKDIDDAMLAIEARNASLKGFLPEGPWKAIADLVEPLVDGVIANAQESRTLSETRDLLLPKLMSGEFRLGDAEKVIEAVA